MTTPLPLEMLFAAIVSACLVWLLVAISRRRALRQLLQTLELVSDANSVAMIACDAHARVLLWSKATERLLGIDRAEALGRPLPERLVGLRRPDNGLERRPPVLLKRADGSNVRVSVSWLNAPGRRTLWIATVNDTSEYRSEDDRAEASRLQRDALIREVHHRIKNSLQGVAGLLRLHLADKPLLKPLLESASSQVYAIAAVHGLQGEVSGGAINVRMLVARVAASVSGIMHSPIVLSERCTSLSAYVVREDESVAVAIVLNELVMNAAKHRRQGGDAIHIDAAQLEGGVELRIRNPGFLPPNFDVDALPQAGNGLGLACSILPRRGAGIGIVEDRGHVVATLTLFLPHVLSLQPAGMETMT